MVLVPMDLVALGYVERRLISPKQAFRVKVDSAHVAPVAPDAVGAAARALIGCSHAEHDDVLRVQRRHGGAWQVRADGVHVETARPAPVAHAADGRVADVAAASAVGRGRLEGERVLAMEEEPCGHGGSRADLVQVEVARVAAVAGASATAAAAVAHEVAVVVVVAAAPAEEIDEHQRVRLVGDVLDGFRYGDCRLVTPFGFSATRR